MKKTIKKKSKKNIALKSKASNKSKKSKQSSRELVSKAPIPGLDMAHLNMAISQACTTHFGVLDSKFMCQSLSVLEPRKPCSVIESTSISEVLALLRREKIGCVLVHNTNQHLVGIFRERDVLLKLSDKIPGALSEPVSTYMTSNPVTQPADGTIAFALNLMSVGGFRHIPIVDKEGVAHGIISVKDVVDYLVQRFTDDLMNFETVAGN